MAEYILTGESVADITRERLAGLNIEWIPYHYSIDGAEYLDDLGETIPFEEFYKKVGSGADVRTSQINISEFQTFWKPFLDEGKDIVHIAFSSGLSGAINSARNAAAILEESYPDRKIYVVDSLAASSGYGLLIVSAAEKRDEGLSAEELAAWIEENRLKVHHWFFSTDLSSYVRGGRISKTAAVFGGMLEICPLLNMDALGRLIPREKIRKKANVIKEIEKRMEQHAKGGLEYSGKCFISQSACYDDARAVADIIESRFPNLDGKVEINWVGTTIGSHTGPSTVALFFFGDERE